MALILIYFFGVNVHWFYFDPVEHTGVKSLILVLAVYVNHILKESILYFTEKIKCERGQYIPFEGFKKNS